MEQNALSTMRTVLQDGSATWRSTEQKEAMMAVLERSSDVVAVLATGAGKSMLAIVPSMMEEATATVLVLPLNSLIRDYQRRLTQMHIPFQLYGEGDGDNNQLELTSNLILVSADKAQTSAWRSALALLAQKKPIARLVFDEAHIPLIAKDYRKTLNYIYQIRSIPMQLVLLTATLPPTFLSELKLSYNLLSNVKVIRQSTNRPEHIYRLEKISSDDFLQRSIQILSEEEGAWSDQDRALIFVTSIALGRKLVDMTNHAFYVGDKNKMTDRVRGDCSTTSRWVDEKDNRLPLPRTGLTYFVFPLIRSFSVNNDIDG
jgi:superfamily II DNA helicase RecQ